MNPDSVVMIDAANDYSEPVDIEELVGMRYPPTPENVEHLAGSLIRNEREPVDRLPWVLSSVRVRGRPVLLLAKAVELIEDREVDRDGRQVLRSSYPIFEVRDAVLLPPLEGGERLALSRCEDADGGRAIGYVQWDINSRIMRARRFAWRADLRLGKLTPTEVIGVACRNPRFPNGP